MEELIKYIRENQHIINTLEFESKLSILVINSHLEVLNMVLKSELSEDVRNEIQEAKDYLLENIKTLSVYE